MRTRALVLALALLGVACEADERAPVVDAAVAVDAHALDAASTVDAALVPDAAPVVDAARDALPADARAPDAVPPVAWRVLLVGNSYVASNRLEVLLEGLLNDDPAIDSAEVARVSRGGYRLIQHATDADTAGTPLHGHLTAPDARWNAVVLQEQSQIPGFPANHPQRVEMAEGAQRLHALARATGARTVLMLTWGRRDGDARNPETFPDYATMQALLNRGYGEVAALLADAIIAPVGPGFGVVLAADEAAFRGLYTNDGSHPSLAGSYLAAAVIYRTLTGRPVADRGWAPAGLADADRLRAWADQAALP